MPSSILLVTSQAKSVHSGVGTYAQVLLDGLRDCGSVAPRVTVATWHEEQHATQHPWCEWIDLGARPSSDPTPGRFWSFGRRLASQLGRDLDRFDLVHFLDARDGHAFVGGRDRKGPRVVGTVHDDYAALVGWSPLHYVGRAADPLSRWLFHRWLRRLERRTYAGFDALMVNSVATASTLRTAYGLTPDRLWPVTLTIAAREGGEGADGDGGGDNGARLPGQPALLFCGGNFYRKGLDTCVRALPMLLQDLPQTRLHVLGACRSQRQIERLAARLGVASSLEFHGRVDADEVARCMAGAQQFVMPSRTEALGLVYLEAFRAGLPVIAGNRGGVAEIVQHRRSGLSVTPEDPAALAAAVHELHRDLGLRQQLVAGGREVLAARSPRRLLAESFCCYGMLLPVDEQATAASPGDGVLLVPTA